MSITCKFKLLILCATIRAPPTVIFVIIMHNAITFRASPYFIVIISSELNAVDYTAVLGELTDKQTSLEESVKRCALVTAPTEAYIIDCLKKVPNVIDIAAATEENDPNGQLNKQGGYTAHVYFSSDLIDQSEFEESSVIEKGTDCGGSIEVYSCVEDATKRNEYLSTFDGGVFASGSHTIVGTVLVRTSDKLTATKQKSMEASIISVLTYLEGDILNLPEQEPKASTPHDVEPAPDSSNPEKTSETITHKPVAPVTPTRKDLAIKRANELARDEPGAERQWVVDWLISVEAYSEEEAQYALANCQVDWKTEALEFANVVMGEGHVNFTSTDSWTTPKDVIRELRYRKFTEEEIAYAMNNCSAIDWVAEATTLARVAGTQQQRDSFRTYTFDEVVTYLQSVGFSRDVAVAGAELCGIDWSLRE